MPTPIAERAVQSLADALPRVDREHAAAARLVLDTRLCTTLQRWIGHPVRLLGMRRRPSTALGLTISSMAGDFAVELDANGDPAVAMLHAMASNSPSIPELPAIVTTWLNTASARDQLEALELKVVDVCALGQATAATEWLPTVRVGACEARVDRIDASFGLFLEEELREAGSLSAVTADGVALQARLELSCRVLPAELLRAASPGDVLLLGTLPMDIAWRIGGRRGRRAGACLRAWGVPPVLTSLPQPFEDPMTDSLPMDACADTVGDIELPVTFEVDARSIDLASLSALGPGQVVSLDRSLEDATVYLRSNGRTLGRGSLVAIGAYLGVRIERMSWTRHGDTER